ncbi:MAG TPA: class IV adenylate cyclase [Alphaproteobacteria bacterium]|nr:class IV adenylate cyclase [Alphaproteobacteria bacterium]
MAAARRREIEVKFKIVNIQLLRRRLRAEGFRLKTRSTHETNTLYDLPGSPLRKSGALLRVRSHGTKWTVTFKGKSRIGRHKSRLELETQVADGLALAEILQGSGFQPTFFYEKRRSEWSDGVGLVMVDQTPIGDFGEIEGPGRWIDRVAKKLGLTSADYITSSYAELFSQWKRRTGSKASGMRFGR